MEEALGANREEKPGMRPLRWLDCWLGFPSGSSCSQVNAKCTGLLSFGLHQWGWEGDSENWAPQDLHTLCPVLHPGEVTSVPLFIAAETTQEAAVMSYKSRPIAIGLGAMGCLQQWGGSSLSHWSATTCLKLSSPKSVRHWPATVCLFHQVLELGETNKQTVILAPGLQQRKKKQSLWLASWNVRTICSGLSEYLQQVDDFRKTAIINHKLKRLSIDITALQGDQTLFKWQPQGTRLYILLAGKGARWTKTAWCGLCSEKLSAVCCWACIWWHSPHPLPSPFNLLRLCELPEHLHSQSMLTSWE